MIDLKVEDLGEQRATKVSGSGVSTILSWYGYGLSRYVE
jgi:hypothetical protein